MSKLRKKKISKTIRHNRRIRTGDTVTVISGNSKGQTGKVVRRTNDRVVVQGLNMKKKHVKKTQESPSGEILSIEAPFHISNVMLAGSEEKGTKLKAGSKGESKYLYYMDGNKQVKYRDADQANK